MKEDKHSLYIKHLMDSGMTQAEAIKHAARLYDDYEKERLSIIPRNSTD
jgi:hypothetical protein